jgi:hypothetical protein
MKALKILVVITALVVIAGVTADAWAQCPTARVFRSAGAVGANVRADISSVENGTNTIGRFWDTDNAAASNNGLTDVVGDGSGFGSLCAPKGATSAWWIFHGSTPGTQWKIDGKLTDSGCAQLGCPATRMTVVVEDYAVSGPPGVGETAYYIGWLINETPIAARWYDYAQVDGLTTQAVLPMLPFPDVVITSSGRESGAVTVNFNYLDQTNNNHTWNTVAGAAYPTADIVKEWQLVKATGSDPGRLRSSGWITLQSVDYVPGGTPSFESVACGGTLQDEYLAVGIGFNGGSAGVIDSALVGKAISLECDPNLAEPELQIQSKPDATQSDSKRGRSSGRR